MSVVGTVSASAYTGNDGVARASLEVQAEDIEFLTPRGEAGEMPASAPAAAPAPRANPGYGSAPQGGGFVQVDEEELPF